MYENEFIQRMQNRIAELSVSASAVRKQGAGGITTAAREYLKTIDLRKFRTNTKKKFKSELNKSTRLLKEKLPQDAKNWGTARKILNLFLRDILYNRYLCDYYKYHRIEQWLEVPLDKYVANGIRREIPADCIPKWDNIKDLTANESNKFQDAANWIARKKKIARVHLDLWYWRNK